MRSRHFAPLIAIHSANVGMGIPYCCAKRPSAESGTRRDAEILLTVYFGFSVIFQVLHATTPLIKAVFVIEFVAIVVLVFCS